MAINDLIINNPRTSIILVALIVTIFITVIRYFLTDKEKMKEIRDRQKELRKEMKEHKNNPEKMMELNKKMLEDFPEQMKQSFKPMVITLIPILLIFGWMRATYALTAIANTWLWWYIGASIIFSIILSKAFGLQ
ncbi:hypothetical protein CMI42_03685 [Candidatus Pacearchaeota archaeon]|nr:hypothetical protein [Candidatus Pacearchaeota archaeon]|tara:strand:- start:1237 stop:1641 length:405 start_codon:yes stop_codon:yes gene_type:complete